MNEYSFLKWSIVYPSPSCTDKGRYLRSQQQGEAPVASTGRGKDKMSQGLQPGSGELTSILFCLPPGLFFFFLTNRGGWEVPRVCPEGLWVTIPSAQVVLSAWRITTDPERQDHRAGFSLLLRGPSWLGFPRGLPFPLEELTPAPSPHHSIFQTGGGCCGQVATWLRKRGSPNAHPWGFSLPRGNSSLRSHCLLPRSLGSDPWPGQWAGGFRSLG